MKSNYDILSIMKMKNKEYSNKFLEEFIKDPKRSAENLKAMQDVAKMFQNNK